MVNYNKMNKFQLKQLIREYKIDLQSKLNEVKSYKLSKLKKAQLVAIVEDLFNPTESIVELVSDEFDEPSEVSNKEEQV